MQALGWCLPAWSPPLLPTSPLLTSVHPTTRLDACVALVGDVFGALVAAAPAALLSSMNIPTVRRSVLCRRINQPNQLSLRDTMVLTGWQSCFFECKVSSRSSIQYLE